MAGFCLLLPFMSASCESEQSPVHWRVTYTGADILTGGRPDIAFTDDVGRRPVHRLDDAGERQVLGEPPPPLPRRPMAWLAAALMTAALAGTALPSRNWRATGTAGLAIPAAVVLFGATMLARRDATDAVATVLSRVTTPASTPAPTVSELRGWEHYGQVGDLLSYEYGFWIAITALSAVGVGNLVQVVRHPARTADGPSSAAEEQGTWSSGSTATPGGHDRDTGSP